ncbi:MAG: AMP-binding protein, partial [Polyangiales bacterium]
APMILTWMAPETFAEAAKEGDSQRFYSCGKGLMQSRVSVMDDDGNILPQGTTGELVVRSNLVTQGYYKNEEATREISEHGWHHTGDIGYQDEEGYFYIIDRKKDMIVTGGFNVFGAEVEKAINSHPAVVDCAVVGVPDEKWGEAIKAVVQLKPGAAVSAQDLIGVCREQLGGVKAPKSVEFVEALPRSPVGKVLKREIREKYWKGQERRVS